MGMDVLCGPGPTPEKSPRLFQRRPDGGCDDPGRPGGFRTELLARANSIVSVLTSMNAQGMICWDIEGAQDEACQYYGDPTYVDNIPEMTYTDSSGVRTCDAYFQTITAAGFRVGNCLRPQQLTTIQGTLWQCDSADPTQTLINKVQYANSHWGSSLFYVDSTSFQNVPAGNPYGYIADPDSSASVIRADYFQAVNAAYPNVILFPENQDGRDYAYAAPLDSYYHQNVMETPQPVRDEWPGAFTLLIFDGIKNQADVPALVDGVSKGDILISNCWYGGQQVTDTNTIYSQAGVIPAIQLTSPADGATMLAGGNLTMTATASAGSGDSISAVTFYLSSTTAPRSVLGTLTAAPYTFQWDNVPAGNYVLSACVTTAEGHTQYSSGSNITVLPNTGLVQWLKADSLGLTNGTPVNTWTDMSAAGNSASYFNNGCGNAPPVFTTNVINGLPVVRFTNSVLRSAGSLTGNTLTVFLVYNERQSAYGQGIMNFGGVELEDWGSSIGGLDQFGPWTDYGSVAIPSGTFGVQSFVVDGATSSVQLDGSTQLTPDMAASYEGGQEYLGSRWDTVSYAPVDFAEVIIYNSALSSSECQQVESYLLTKYGISSAACAAPIFNPVAGTYGSTQSVAISTTTGAAIIRYTTDGTTPSETNGTIYSSAVNISANTTLQAIAYEGGMADSPITSGVYTIQCAAPTFSPAAGAYGPAQSVTISTTTSGATIRYTTDGSTPSESAGTVYSSAVNISSTATLKAIAYNSGMADSSVTSGVYTINGACATPTFNPAAGAYGPAQLVTISTTTTGATIRYTTDGTTPSETNGTVYGSAVNISSTCTLQAIAYETGYSDSTVASGVYTINGACATPIFSPAAGAYGPAQSVTISTTTNGATIRYTTDGTTPSETNGTVYGSAVNISSTCTLQAIAYETGYSDSTVASGVYTINGACATPTFSPTAGTFTTSTARHHLHQHRWCDHPLYHQRHRADRDRRHGV